MLCKTDGKDVSLMPVWYQEMEIVQAFDIATIDCVVGQIKISNHWGIIDQSFGSQHAMIHGMWEPEDESEDDSN